MLNVSDETKKIYENRSAHKEVIIRFPDLDMELRNDKLYQDSLSITETLCDEQTLRFGACCASKVSVQIRDAVNAMSGIEMQVFIKIDGSDEEIPLGIYTVDKPRMAANLGYKILTGYDRMTWLDIDVTSWYESLYPNGTEYHSVKELRTGLLDFCGIEYEDVELVNDDIMVSRNLDAQNDMSGRKIMEQICEINGCFGHINRYGKFTWISIEGATSLYPSDDLYPSDNLFPVDARSRYASKKVSFYRECNYEDYLVHSIEGVQLVDTGGNEYLNGDINDNIYVISDNFCFVNADLDTFKTISERLLAKINNIEYLPLRTTVFGYPYVEVGDTLIVETQKNALETIILKRTLTGIQNLQDSYESSGTEYYENNISSLTDKINKLNAITYKTKIRVERTNDSLVAEVSRAQQAEGELSASIAINAEAIIAEVSRANDVENLLSSRITQTADSISAEVTRAKNAEQSLSASIKITADSISSKVSKGDVISEINQEAGKIKMEALDIDLSGYVTFSSLSASGQTNINGDNIKTGTIMGKVGLWVQSDESDRVVTINADGIYNAATSYLNDVAIYGSLKDGNGNDIVPAAVQYLNDGWWGTFPTANGWTVTVQNGVITSVEA